MTSLAQQQMSVHGSIVVVGEAGILARGPSGAGKSRFAQALIAEGIMRGLFARLVADDRVSLTRQAGRLVAHPPAGIVGLIEERGSGLLETLYERAVIVRILVDLGASGVPRMPTEEDLSDGIAGVVLPRLRLDRSVPPVEGARRVVDKLAGFQHAAGFTCQTPRIAQYGALFGAGRSSSATR